VPTTSKKSSNLFFSGVLILTLSNILIKVIGLTLKIPLHALLGDDGMAYYNTAYDIYVWLYMVSTQGIPVAVSILISESRAKGNFRESKRIFRITLGLFIVIGLAGMFVMMGGSKLFAAAYKFEESYLSIIAIAPTLFFICISSAMRGYFQGYQDMAPTAVSQIIEALGKLIIGILFANWAISKGCSTAEVAAYTILGLTIGVAAGMLFLCVSKLLFNEAPYNAEFLKPDSDTLEPRPVKTLLKAIIVTSIPIMLSSSVMSFTNVIDGIIISRRLQGIGYTEEMARVVFGNYKTLAVSMFNMPPSLIYPITYSLIPLLSATIASGDTKRVEMIQRSTLKLASIIAIPCALGMSVLSEPILKLIFAAESAEMAAPLLSVLSLSIFFIGMLSMTNAVLQSHKQERKPVISLVCGSVVKLISSYVLIGIPGVEMFGAPIGTFLCYLTIVAMNFYFMAKYVGVSPKITVVFVKPFIASAICSVAAVLSYRLFDMVIGGRTATLAAVMVAVIVYAAVLLVIRGITREDLTLLPKGEKIARIMEKLHLVK